MNVHQDECSSVAEVLQSLAIGMAPNQLQRRFSCRLEGRIRKSYEHVNGARRRHQDRLR